jgi:hypothetical protein
MGFRDIVQGYHIYHLYDIIQRFKVVLLTGHNKFISRDNDNSQDSNSGQE